MHFHPCVDCGARVECDGDLERNHDGFPATICRSFHLTSGIVNEDWVCMACAHRRDEADKAAESAERLERE